MGKSQEHEACKKQRLMTCWNRALLPWIAVLPNWKGGNEEIANDKSSTRRKGVAFRKWSISQGLVTMTQHEFIMQLDFF